jgi:hypothetical protein
MSGVAETSQDSGLRQKTVDELKTGNIQVTRALCDLIYKKLDSDHGITNARPIAGYGSSI